MDLKYKVRIYALFQFISFAALIFITIGIITSFIDSPNTGVFHFWNERLYNILRFEKVAAYDVLGSVFVYLGIIQGVGTWAIALMLYRFHDRNFYDRLFLMFFWIPAFSNLFALFAQLSLETKLFTNPKLAKEDIEQEKTRLINLFSKQRSLVVPKEKATSMGYPETKEFRVKKLLKKFIKKK